MSSSSRTTLETCHSASIYLQTRVDCQGADPRPYWRGGRTTKERTKLIGPLEGSQPSPKAHIIKRQGPQHLAALHLCNAMHHKLPIVDRFVIA